MQKKTLLPYLTLVLFTLFGCENENLKNENSPEQSTDQTSKAKINNLSLDELSKDKQFEELSSVFKLDETFETAKRGLTKKEPSGKNDFEIDFSSVNKMESKAGTSYTFMIKNDEEIPKHFENFVVEKHIDGTVSGFIVYYEYSKRYLDSLKKGIVIPFDGTVRRTKNKENLEELKDFYKGKKTAKSSTTAKSTAIDCTETRYVTQSLCPGTERHSNGQGPCPWGINGIWYGYYLQTVISCIDTDTWGWVADTQSYTSSIPDPNVTSGGGSYSTTATVQPSLFSDVSTIQSFVNTYGLTGNEVEWARYIPNRSKVNNFMDENGYIPKNQGFVKEAANASVNGGIVDFGYIIINKLTGKSKCIYERLKNTSTGFENAIRKFDGEFPVSHLKLTINNNLPSNVYGQTQLPVNYVTEIQFNDNSFTFLSDLGKATVFAHEVIHAEIFRKMLSAAQVGTLMPTSSNMTPQQQTDYVNSLKNNFPGLYDYYFSRYKPTWNHEMMANHYRKIIADIIQEFDNNRLPRSTYEAVAWLGLGVLDTNLTTIAWDNLSEQERGVINTLIKENFYSGPSTCN